MTLSVVRPLPLPADRPSGLRLLSDLHIGSPDVDYGLVGDELAAAEEAGDRVLLNGDLFDALLVRDSKRFQPSELHPRLQGHDDTVNKALDWAEELLGPHSDRIDLVGAGNHERSNTKHHSSDLIELLVRRLQARVKAPGHRIAYGGYCGLLAYGFRARAEKGPGRRGAKGWSLAYWHGSGGGSGLGGGLGEFSTKGAFIEGTDAFWYGHRHLRLVSQVVRVEVPAKSLTPVERPVWLLRTGAYMRTTSCPALEDKNVRRLSYAAENLLAPLGRGGLRVVLDPTTPRAVSSRVEVCS